MRQRSQGYWQKRSLERLTASEKNSIPYLRAIQNAYQQAAKATVQDIQDAYAAYYSKDNRAFDRMKLEDIVPQGDLERFWAQMEKAGLSTYLPDNFKGRVTRAELLNAQAWAEVKKAALAEERLSSKSYRNTYKESYYRSAFDTQKGAETLTDFAALDKKAAEAVLSTRFLGQNYSQRIWGNTDRLAGELKEILAAAMATGQSVERITREVMDRFNVGRNNAIRLVRTETNYFHNQAELASYRELGIDEFEFMATLDAKTSPMCQAMDGKHFKISKAMVGENVPPLHPYCRSTIIPYIGAEWRPKERVAIDPQTGESVTIKNMSYAYWLTNVVNATPQAIAGVAQGVAMSHNQAAGGRVNPGYIRGVKNGRHNNCQSASLVYEARRRGYDLEALPYSDTNKIAVALSHDPLIAWRHRSTGEAVDANDLAIRAGTVTKMNPRKYIALLKKTVRPNRRYIMRFEWSGSGAGHVVNVLVSPQGKISIYEAQSDMLVTEKDLLKYFMKVKWGKVAHGIYKKMQPALLRVDDKDLVYNVINQISRRSRK